MTSSDAPPTPHPIGMVLEMASRGEPETFGLRTHLLVPDGLKEFGRELLGWVGQGITDVVWHRHDGEVPGGPVDFFSRRRLMNHTRS